MDPVVARVVARVKRALAELLQRIEAVHGWQRSNFLQSVHDQARRGRALSPKQLAVLEKIEKEQGGRAPASPGPAHGAIPFGTKQYGHEKKEVEAVLNALREHGTAKVFDPKGILSTNKKLQEHIVQEMATDFWAQAEYYAERNADEDDPQKHDENQRVRESAEAAASEMYKAHLTVKVEGGTTVVSVRPTPADLRRKHRLD